MITIQKHPKILKNAQESRLRACLFSVSYQNEQTAININSYGNKKAISNDGPLYFIYLYEQTFIVLQIVCVLLDVGLSSQDDTSL